MPHRCDSLSHPRGEHALWVELCDTRRELAEARRENADLRARLAAATQAEAVVEGYAKSEIERLTDLVERAG